MAQRRNPYRRTRHRRVSENARFRIYLDDVVGPNGDKIQNYLVVIPKARVTGKVTGVAVLPIIEGRIGLLRIYRHPVGDYVWEVPRGFVDSGETPGRSALRELKEETGLKCRRTDLHPLGEIMPEPGILAARVRLFAALIDGRANPSLSREFGHNRLRLVTTEEFARLSLRGRIQDPCTLISYYRYLQHGPNAARNEQPGEHRV